MLKHDKHNEKQKNKSESTLITKESLCAACALFCTLALLILFSGSAIFGDVGGAVRSFLTGAFGYIAYPLLLGGMYLSVTGLLGIRLVKNRKGAACFLAAVVIIALIAQIATTYSWSVKGYVSACFDAGESFPKATIAGAVGGVIIFSCVSVLSKIGSIVLFVALTGFFGYLFVLSMKKTAKPVVQKEQESETVPSGQAYDIPLMNAQPQTAATETAYSEPQYAQYSQPMQSAQPVPQPAQPAPTQNAYSNYSEVQVSQRPGVSLFEEEPTEKTERQAPQIGAFSPFGTPQNMRNDVENGTNYEESRAILFSTTPQESYQRNLIFDPNSNVNKRAPAEAVQPTVQSAYTPSYTEAYQDSVNASSQPQRPVEVIDDSSYSAYERQREEERQATQSAFREPIAPSPPVPVAPMQPLEEEKPVPQETVSYPNIEVSAPIAEEPIPTPIQREEPTAEYKRHDYMDLFSSSNPRLFSEENSSLEENLERTSRESSLLFKEETEETEKFTRNVGFSETPEESRSGRDGMNLLDDEDEEPQDDLYSLRSDFDVPQGRGVETRSRGELFEETSRGREFGFDREETAEDLSLTGSRVAESVTPPAPVEPPKPVPAPPKPRIRRPYVRPYLDDFNCKDIEPTANHEEVEQTKADIIATLEDFKITGATIASVTFGPTVTRYNVALPRSVSPKKVVALDQSIAISLHSSGVNIYPNYEDGVVSIEVPNKERQFVQLGCMLSGDTFVNAKPSSLMFAMGKDVANRKVYGDICKMTHLLVAGASNSGKSVFLGALILSLIYKYSPDELRLILIDPKKTEFVLYNDLPHLMINEIITDVNKTIQSLNWAIGEMNRRYTLFGEMSKSGKYVVNLDQYNEQMEKNDRLPKIVIIIDELADLMLAAKKEIEDRIQSLTQKARAAGIHVIVATQRPSADVITGVIKSNLSTRIAFLVPSDVDSRVILDQTGAQKLLGKGDLLYTMPGINTPVRVQSAFSAPEEAQRVVEFIKSNNEAYFDEEATAFINNSRSVSDEGEAKSRDAIEPVYIDALRYVILNNSASISMIQRKCSAGYNKAGKIVEWMEEMGYISPFEGAKARKVLITKEQFEELYGPL